MTTLAVYSFNLLNLQDSNNDIVRMLNIVEASTTAPSTWTVDTKAAAVGKILGQIFTKIFNFQVPDVQYQVYNWVPSLLLYKLMSA